MAYTHFTTDGFPVGSGYPPASQRQQQTTGFNSQTANGSHVQYLQASSTRPNPIMAGAIPPMANHTSQLSEALVHSYSLSTPHPVSLQPVDTSHTNSPLTSDGFSPTMFYISQNSNQNSIPYSPLGDYTLCEDQDWSPNYPSDEYRDESIPLDDQSAAARRQRRIESERRYRNRAEEAYAKLTESFELWVDEIGLPSKKTRESHMRHATRLVRKGAEYSRKYKQASAEIQQLRQKLHAATAHRAYTQQFSK